MLALLSFLYQSDNCYPERCGEAGRGGEAFVVWRPLEFVFGFLCFGAEGEVGEDSEVGFSDDCAGGKAGGMVAEGGPDADG